MRRVVVIAFLMMVPAFSGCIQDAQDGLDRFFAPRADVFHTSFVESDWNRNGHVTLDIRHDKPLSGTIEYFAGDEVPVSLTVDGAEATLLADGIYRTRLDTVVPDGTWEIRMAVDGHTWARYRDVWIDSVPPEFRGLESGGHAPDGTYVLGSSASVSDGTIEVRDATGNLLGTQFPVTVSDLPDGVHVIQVVATDAAGNRNTRLVQVIAGKATDLPEGDATFGIVSRYTIQAELWDLSRAGEYLMPAEARSEVSGYLGSGHGVTPDDPVIQALVDELTHPSMTTMEVAYTLYQWLFDELEYDEERLASNTLMLPRHVVQDTEDPDAEANPGQDDGDDGLSDDGSGNGVRGGVCRDLAGTYVSMLRAAGVPARLVTGYLAGTVNGFHAWVEVYVGELGGQAAWMPVDVSPIDGQWDDAFGPSDRGPAIAMQSFGIRLPDYLPLRSLEDSEEIKGWSTAISAAYSYPSDEDPPEVEFIKDTVHNFQETGVLCVDEDTLQREMADQAGDCKVGNLVYGWDGSKASFVIASVQIIDYGVVVDGAAPGTTVDIEVAYPFNGQPGYGTNELEPALVEFETYHASNGASSTVTGHGTVRATLTY